METKAQSIMTLIITAATKDYIFQVADTRLTKVDGTSFDDNNIKSTVAHCKDVKIVLSYTGLAYIIGQRTDLWLVSKLKEFNCWDKVFNEVLNFIVSELTKTASFDPNLAKYGLTFVIAGLGKNKFGVNDTAIAIISNYLTPNATSLEFDSSTPTNTFKKHVFTLQPGFGYYISEHGAGDSNPDIDLLRRKLVKELPQAKTAKELDRIMYYLIGWLRLQAKDPKSSHLISEDCTVTHIGRDYKSSLFFFTKDKKIRRFPNIVSKDKSMTNLTYKQNSDVV